MNEQDITRARMLGSLIREARLHAGRTVEECAQVLGMTQEAFAAAEAGEQIVSLPGLEVLSMYLDVPMAHFWGSHRLKPPPQPNYQALLALRHKIVGGLLRQARLDAGKTPEELALALGVDVAQIQAYEMGSTPIPYLELEKLSRQIGVSVDYFLDDARGPLGKHEAAKERQQLFSELPAELQAFVTRPTNINYLETAMRLSELDVDRLRTIAASILDITF